MKIKNQSETIQYAQATAFKSESILNVEMLTPFIINRL